MQQVKDPTLSLQWLGFSSWSWNFQLPWAQPKKKKVDDVPTRSTRVPTQNCMSLELLYSKNSLQSLGYGLPN